MREKIDRALLLKAQSGRFSSGRDLCLCVTRRRDARRLRSANADLRRPFFASCYDVVIVIVIVAVIKNVRVTLPCFTHLFENSSSDNQKLRMSHCRFPARQVKARTPASTRFFRGSASPSRISVSVDRFAVTRDSRNSRRSRKNEDETELTNKDSIQSNR